MNTDGRGEVEHNWNDQDMRMLELMSSTVGDRGYGSDYATPYSIPASTFAEKTLKVEKPVYANIQ